MSQNIITELRPEQEALIPVYREKWKAIALSTETIDRQKASEAIKAAYAVIGKQEPRILFFDSPNAALRELRSKMWSKENQLRSQLRNQLRNQLRSQLGSQLWTRLRNELGSQLGSYLVNQLVNQLCNGEIQPELWTCDGSWIDFCIAELHCTYYQRQWKVFQSLVEDCGWIFPYQSTCLVCDRPIKLTFDSENCLHAEGEPAIQFADRFSVYSYHGVTLPEKYGILPPHRWQVQWLIEETNAELRRVLIQGIGYGRICAQLQATEINSWREYTLLRINNHVDVEPINLLKMTCPSTGFIHVLRVPPDVKSARQAIRWVNWGVDPDRFALQS